MENSPTMKAIIIEDDPFFQQTLADLLGLHVPEVSVEGIAGSASEAKLLLNKEKPNIVFIDVELPDKSGIEFLRSLPFIDFHVVFITGHKEYAIDAIKIGAVDYILKPIEAKDVVEAVNNVKRSMQGRDAITPSESATPIHHRVSDGYESSLVISTIKGWRILRFDEVIYLKGEGNYTSIHQTGESKGFVTSKTLKHFEQICPPVEFYRIHKSYLINLRFVKEILRENFSYHVVMTNNDVLTVSRNKFEDFFSKLQLRLP